MHKNSAICFAPWHCQSPLLLAYLLKLIIADINDNVVIYCTIMNIIDMIITD